MLKNLRIIPKIQKNMPSFQANQLYSFKSINEIKRKLEDHKKTSQLEGKYTGFCLASSGQH